MTLREGAARTGFQILLERDGASFVSELDRNNKCPGAVLGRVRTASGIMPFDPSRHVLGKADIVAPSVGDAVKPVHIPFLHGVG